MGGEHSQKLIQNSNHYAMEIIRGKNMTRGGGSQWTPLEVLELRTHLGICLFDECQAKFHFEIILGLIHPLPPLPPH